MVAIIIKNSLCICFHLYFNQNYMIKKNPEPAPFSTSKAHNQLINNELINIPLVILWGILLQSSPSHENNIHNSFSNSGIIILIGCF